MLMCPAAALGTRVVDHHDALFDRADAKDGELGLADDGQPTTSKHAGFVIVNVPPCTRRASNCFVRAGLARSAMRGSAREVFLVGVSSTTAR